MRRREFITFPGGAAVAGSVSLRAEQSSRARRIGVLVNEPWPAVEGLHVGLDELGYREAKISISSTALPKGPRGGFFDSCRTRSAFPWFEIISGSLGELVRPCVDDRIAINVRDTGHDALLELML